MNVGFVKVELRINGIRHYYFPSSIMGGQINDLIDALYVLYHEEEDSHYIHRQKPAVDWKETEKGNDAAHISSQFTWDEEETLVKVSLRRAIKDSDWRTNPHVCDPVVIKISGGRCGNDFECTIDGRDLCYAAAKGYTEALKKYGFYGYFFSTCGNFNLGASVLMERFLFIKAYALNAMETRVLSKAWDNPHSWRHAYRTDFEKEIELLLFDM